MKHTQRLLLTICIFGLLLLFAATTIGRAQSGSYFLSWFSFSGGGQISGNGYTMSSVIGHPLNGAQSGGGYSLQIGSIVLTGTLNSTPTFTATPSPTPTFTPTPSPTVTPTATQNDLGDSFEPDNSCSSAKMINVNETLQEHSFHQAGDVDWLRFDTLEAVEYKIEVTIPPGSPANVKADLYLDCADSALGDPVDEPNSPGLRIMRKSPRDGALYLKLYNKDNKAGGQSVSYRVSVRQVEAQQSGALILMAGRLSANDGKQNRIYKIADDVYRLFQIHDYTKDDIYYLTTYPFNSSDDKYDAVASEENFHNAISQWAKSHVSAERPLTIYLVDHGTRDLFYIDGSNQQYLTPGKFDSWLSELEASVVGLKVNVIIEACNSGSFIQSPGSISKANRVIITSTDSNNPAFLSATGAYFSDQFITQLMQGSDLQTSFVAAKSIAELKNNQTAWMDADGNTVANQPTDYQIAAQRSFSNGTLPGNPWPPVITDAQLDNQLLIATIMDDNTISHTWAVVIPPSYTPPSDSNQLVDENAQEMQWNSGTGRYELTPLLLNEVGEYRILIYAEDDDGLVSQPFELTVQGSQEIFLPLVVR